jgi:chemotaxis protein methyltransferase CheR
MTDVAADINPKGNIDLTEKEFRLISGLVHEKFGVHLTEKKKALIKGRLNSLMKFEGHSTFNSLYESVVNDESGKGMLSLIDRLTTNHSYFFREADHFRFLEETILPELRLEKGDRLRIWSAGCASGEEPYTIALMLLEHFGVNIRHLDIGIIGTDISMTALDQGSEGVYPEQRIGRLPAVYRKYFKKNDNGLYKIDDKAKKLIMFKRLNLMEGDYPFRGQFQIIFCRNVMIYFDQETKLNLVQKFRHYLGEGGYLLIGHSETLGRHSDGYKYIRPTVYKRQ